MEDFIISRAMNPTEIQELNDNTDPTQLVNTLVNGGERTQLPRPITQQEDPILAILREMKNNMRSMDSSINSLSTSVDRKINTLATRLDWTQSVNQDDLRNSTTSTSRSQSDTSHPDDSIMEGETWANSKHGDTPDSTLPVEFQDSDDKGDEATSQNSCQPLNCLKEDRGISERIFHNLVTQPCQKAVEREIRCPRADCRHLAKSRTNTWQRHKHCCLMTSCCRDGRG